MSPYNNLSEKDGLRLVDWMYILRLLCLLPDDGSDMWHWNGKSWALNAYSSAYNET